MTIVGSKRMIVYDDIAAQEKIKVFDVRVERPPHYDTFAEFHYAYHYGDTYCPYIKQDEPLKTECQHFVQCIFDGTVPLTSGRAGMEVVRILEASSSSLKKSGAPVHITSSGRRNSVVVSGSVSTNPFPNRILNGSLAEASKTAKTSENSVHGSAKKNGRAVSKRRA
jgi:hypothetical protein